MDKAKVVAALDKAKTWCVMHPIVVELLVAFVIGFGVGKFL